jgi:pyruvate kinase
MKSKRGFMKKHKHLKTQIVCTIGPACRSEKMLRQLMLNGMTVARLNFAHGNFEQQGIDIANVRKAAKSLGRHCAILIDLPGPKIRLGKLKKEPIYLKVGDSVKLTTENVLGTTKVLPVNYDQITKSVKKGGLVYLNDGFLQLRVLRIESKVVYCKVLIGGELYSFKGLNLPEAKMFVDPITEHDLKCVDFGLKEGVNLYGVSFVEKDDDIIKLKAYARAKGFQIRTVAKIERQEAVENINSILQVTDAVMVARGDLGVQIPIEDVPVVQKRLIYLANRKGVSVITATQMLESMVHNIRPTRAEVTDVANAIFDGTDAVMLSEETAMGEYPAETVEMMAKVVSSVETFLQKKTSRFLTGIL